MPKKRKQIPFNKPQTSAHPSITRSRDNDCHDDSFREQDTPKSVNGLLQHLRVSQAPPVVSTEPGSDLNPQTSHPWTSGIAPSSIRPGMRPFSTQGRRRPPGPAPPKSWLNNSVYAPPHVRKASLQHSHDAQQRPNLETLEPLPDTNLPEKRTLQHQTLLHIAKNWDFHAQYDQFYLATLSVRYKQILLVYIAKYSPNGIDLNGLQTLFRDESQLSDATGTEGLTHVELAGSIGRSLTLKDLKHFLAPKNQNLTPNKTKTTHAPTSIPDSWDSVIDTIEQAHLDSPTKPSLHPALPTLTHLSLSHPPPQTSWRALLALKPHLQTLTYLSLAGWPTPSLTPNSTSAYTSTPTGRTIAYGTSNIYSHTLDNDYSGAASVLRQLARDTYCLRHVDLTGNAHWLPALAWREGGIEWEGAWSGVRTVRVGQGWIPPVLRREGVYAWKIVLGYHGDEAEKKREALELRRWVATELMVKDVCWKVRSGRARTVVRTAGGRRRRGEEDMAWGDEEKERRERERRVCNVEFERGWEGWWIEDCVRWYKEHGAVQYS
ncbi:MAG: hypothetical protein Q9170_003730 [Blastenia crenularia]